MRGPALVVRDVDDTTLRAGTTTATTDPMSAMRTLLLFLLLAASTPLVIRAERDGAAGAATPCYAIVTAIVPDSTPLRVRRVVSSGVRRFATGGNAAPPPSCAVGDPARLAEIRRRVTAELGHESGVAQWISLESVDSAVAGDHLQRLARAIARDSAIVIVRIDADTDLVRMRSLR